MCSLSQIQKDNLIKLKLIKYTHKQNRKTYLKLKFAPRYQNQERKPAITITMSKCSGGTDQHNKAREKKRKKTIIIYRTCNYLRRKIKHMNRETIQSKNEFSNVNGYKFNKQTQLHFFMLATKLKT